MLQKTRSLKYLLSLIDMVKCDEVGTIDDGDDCENKMVQKLSSENLNRLLGFLTLKAKLSFTKLRKMFTKALILRHFDLECHIRIKTDASGYTIGEIISQLTLNNLGQWHLIAFYLQKMILPKTWYEIYYNKLLVIVETFKTWRHYLKDCKHKVFMLINHNNLCFFIDTKNLSSK